MLEFKVFWNDINYQNVVKCFLEFQVLFTVDLSDTSFHSTLFTISFIRWANLEIQEKQLWLNFKICFSNGRVQNTKGIIVSQVNKPLHPGYSLHSLPLPFLPPLYRSHPHPRSKNNLRCHSCLTGCCLLLCVRKWQTEKSQEQQSHRSDLFHDFPEWSRVWTDRLTVGYEALVLFQECHPACDNDSLELLQL